MSNMTWCMTIIIWVQYTLSLCNIHSPWLGFNAGRKAALETLKDAKSPSKGRWDAMRCHVRCHVFHQWNPSWIRGTCEKTCEKTKTLPKMLNDLNASGSKADADDWPMDDPGTR